MLKNKICVSSSWLLVVISLMLAESAILKCLTLTLRIYVICILKIVAMKNRVLYSFQGKNENKKQITIIVRLSIYIFIQLLNKSLQILLVENGTVPLVGNISFHSNETLCRSHSNENVKIVLWCVSVHASILCFQKTSERDMEIFCLIYSLIC